VRKLDSINITKLNIPYRDNEESAERTSMASPCDNIVRGVFRSFWKERSVVGD
jgi:hypothetical protein